MILTNVQIQIRILKSFIQLPTNKIKKEDDEWKGEKGWIDIAILKRYLNSDDIEKGIFYICGPPAMVKAMQDILEVDLQIPAERLKIEEFTGY